MPPDSFQDRMHAHPGFGVMFNDPASKPTVLVVDDDVHVHAFVRAALEEIGLEVNVTAAFSGEEALRKILPSPHSAPLCSPDLIVLDLNMPGLGGADVLRVLRATPATEELPVLVLTGTDDPRVLSEAFRSGADSVLSKNLDPTEYHEQLAANVVKYLIDRSSAEKRISAAHAEDPPETDNPC